MVTFRPLDLKFATTVRLLLTGAMIPLKHSYFEKIGGTERTDRQTEGREDGRCATLNAAM